MNQRNISFYFSAAFTLVWITGGSIIAIILDLKPLEFILFLMLSITYQLIILIYGNKIIENSG